MRKNNSHIKSARSAMITLVFSMLLFGLSRESFVYADEIWTAQLQAKAAVEAGNTGDAIPYWEFLCDHFVTIEDWESAAIYAGDLDEYYDSIKDYEKAIRYYELENEYWVKFGKDWGAVDLQRADQIRTTLEMYISTDDVSAIKQSAAPVKGDLAKYEPESGTYIGMYSEQDPQMGNYFTRSESIYGKKHALYLAYTQWGKAFPAGHAKNAKEAGAGLQIGFEPMNGLDEVTDGPYLRKWARDAKASGIPIFLRYASEMNGAWTAWHGDSEQYIEKFRMVYKVMQEEAPNVAMVWSPGDVPMYSMDAYYPGDDYVDWVGVSLYTEPYENGDPSKPPMLATSPIERLNELYTHYAERKPIMLSETAVSHYAHANDKAFTDWAVMNLDRLYSVMPKKYPRLKAITYFNVDLKGKESNNNYLLRNNNEMMQAYKQLISAPTMLTKIGKGAKPAEPIGFKKIDGSVSFSKKARLVPFIKIPDVYIGKVEYVWNGEVISTQIKAPYFVDLDAAAVSGEAEFEIRVYNLSDEQVVHKSVSFITS